MEQLRIPELDLPTRADEGVGETTSVARLRRGTTRRSGRVDWRLDPNLRRLGQRKVHETRRRLDEARQSQLAEAS